MKRALLLTILMASPALANEIDRKGNGGGAIVCRDSEGVIRSAELLDFWEAELTGQQITRRADPADQQIKTSLARLRAGNPSFYERVAAELKIVQAVKIEVGDGVAIQPPTDTESAFLKEGCALEGVAVFMESNNLDPSAKTRLYLNPRILAAMPHTDQAALWLHEAIYKVLRDDDSEKNSVRTRWMVRSLFSDDLENLIDTRQTHQHCVSRPADRSDKKVELFVFPPRAGMREVELLFTRSRNGWEYPARIEVTQPLEEASYRVWIDELELFRRSFYNTPVDELKFRFMPVMLRLQPKMPPENVRWEFVLQGPARKDFDPSKPYYNQVWFEETELLPSDDHIRRNASCALMPGEND